MRQRILDATILLIGEKGYGAATMKAIASAAGCSVGALQHQFASKALLMTAVLDELLDNRIDAYRRNLAETPVEQGIDSLVAGTWSVARQPTFLAMVEIVLARRSDDELRRATERSLKRGERLLERWTMRLWTQYGIDPPVTAAARRLHGAFLTGIAVRVASGLEPDPDSLLRAWERLVRSFAEDAGLREILIERT